MGRSTRSALVVICTIASLLAVATPARAATITVSVDSLLADGVDDGFCSLREAVEAANLDAPDGNGDCPAGSGADRIDLPPGTILLNGPDDPIEITEDLTISGQGMATSVVDATGQTDSVFVVDLDATVTFDGFAITKGIGGGGLAGGVHLQMGELTLDSMRFAGNVGGVAGAVGSFDDLVIRDTLFEDNGGILGGAVFTDTGTLTIESSTFERGGAFAGGAVAVIDALVTIDDGTFADNEAVGGGAISAIGSDVTIENSTFHDNHADEEGGAITADGSDVTIESSTFTDNHADLFGGAVLSDCACGGGSFNLFDSDFTSNTADLGGGALIVAGPGNISTTVFTGNEAEIGGAIGGSGDPTEILTIDRAVFDDNSATEDGGAIYTEFLGLDVTDSTFIANHADDEGGALAADDAPVAITGSTLSGNSAVDNGGAINYEQDDPDPIVLGIINSTISGNTAPGEEGGGLYLDGPAVLLHTTVTDNSAGDGAGIFVDPGGFGEADAYSTIVANNNGAPDCSEALSDMATNIDSDGSCFPASGVGSVTADPLLGPLDNNGGPTQTHALPPNSPAVNTADGAACAGANDEDQRGFQRPAQGACDVGAFEYQPPPAPPPHYNLKVDKTGVGTITGESALGIDCGSDCSSLLLGGTNGVLTAAPGSGYEFAGWSGDCAQITATQCTVQMNGHRTVQATFTELPPEIVERGRCKGMEVGSTNVLEDGARLVVGTPGDDTFTGTIRTDIICGLAGNDTITGASADDILLGGAGDDTIRGGKGRDKINGGAGTDSCFGGRGKNKIINCE